MQPKIPKWRTPFLLFLCAYTFMLRVPSECLLVAAHACGLHPESSTPTFHIATDHVRWFLPTRKNWARPSVIKRACWCTVCTKTCPVHILGPAFASLPAGQQPFARITKDHAIKLLRQLLSLLNVEEAASFGTHDCRRGHCDDMVRAGKGLTEILTAGGWRSASGQKSYTNAVDLEMKACLEAHFTALQEDD